MWGAWPFVQNRHRCGANCAVRPPPAAGQAGAAGMWRTYSWRRSRARPASALASRSSRVPSALSTKTEPPVAAMIRVFPSARARGGGHRVSWRCRSGPGGGFGAQRRCATRLYRHIGWPLGGPPCGVCGGLDPGPRLTINANLRGRGLGDAARVGGGKRENSGEDGDSHYWLRRSWMSSGQNVVVASSTSPEGDNLTRQRF